MHNSNPYFYVIKHIPSSRLYAGIRSTRGCHPDELLRPIKGYTTSSKYVNELIKSDGLESFKVLYTITEEELGIDIYAVEYEFLTSHNAAKSDIWLNKTNGGGCKAAMRKHSIRKFVAHNIHTGEEIIGSFRELYEIHGIPSVKDASTKDGARLIKGTYYAYPVGRDLAEHIKYAEKNEKKKMQNFKAGGAKAAKKSTATKRNASIQKYGFFELHFLSGDKEPIHGALVDFYNLGYKKVYSWERDDSISLKMGVVLIKAGEDLVKAIERKTKRYNELQAIARSKGAEKNSVISKGRLQKNSVFYQVFKDGVMILDRDILKTHCEKLGVVYTTARLAISKNRAVKQGYLFVECK